MGGRTVNNFIRMDYCANADAANFLPTIASDFLLIGLMLLLSGILMSKAITK